jgi:hypothetical protein
LPLVDFGEDKVVGLRLSGDREALQKESHLQRKAQGWDKVVEEGRVGRVWWASRLRGRQGPYHPDFSASSV